MGAVLQKVLPSPERGEMLVAEGESALQKNMQEGCEHCLTMSVGGLEY